MAADNPGKHVHGAGTGVKYSLLGTPGTFTQLNDVVSVDLPPMVMGRIPDSVLRTADKIMRKAPGWMDPGEITIQLMLTKAQLSALFDLFFDRFTLYWNIVYPTASDLSTVGYFAFQGWIGNLQPGKGIQRDQNENIMIDMTIVLTTMTSSAYQPVGTGSG